MRKSGRQASSPTKLARQVSSSRLSDAASAAEVEDVFDEEIVESRRARGAIVAILGTLASGTRASAADSASVAAPEPDEALYVRALHAMAALPVPPYVTYRVAGHRQGLRADLVPDSTCLVRVTSGTNAVDWTEDDAAEIADRASDARLHDHTALFDPTWRGTYRDLRRRSESSAFEHDSSLASN